MSSEANRHRTPRVPWGTHLFFLAVFTLVLLLIHVPLLDLPFYWDEVGQFIPAAMDILTGGFWVPHSATPNVHPPGVMAYLALVWRVFGYSLIATRVAMLVLAGVAVWLAFLLAIELCRNVGGAPAFTAVLLLVVSPVFYTQAMLAQLDMPAMLLTILALLLFLKGRLRLAALASVALVLVKETGLVVPLVFAGWLVWERRTREAAWFLLPCVALAAWLALLWRETGHLFGNTEFTNYNLTFPLHPVRLAIALARRFFYLFVESFHWVGWVAVALAWRRTRAFAGRSWRIAATVAVMQVLAVTALGGAVLERYLLPVLPLMYTAFAAAWAAATRPWLRAGQAVVCAGLIASLFWNPPYPYPYENNLAMVDFVRLQRAAARYVEDAYSGRTITTAWPLSIELRRPVCGYVTKRMAVREVPSFQPEDVRAAGRTPIEVFVLFSRDWEGGWDLRQMPLMAPLMRRFYRYEPQMPPHEVERALGLKLVARWASRGQWIAVYSRPQTSAMPVSRPPAAATSSMVRRDAAS
ncbi:MAG TPA: glycosyltransferase family 39 protein [Bryobacteraceae bacterium]|nr:glycosyltransferase family 39 protein [Bryobacteraceae bacterium]